MKMNYMIVYQSVTGNTALLAEEIRNKLEKETCCYYGQLDEVTEEKLSEVDFIFVGFWTDKGTCNEEMENFLKKLKNKKIALFGTAGFGKSEQYFEQILERVEENIDSSNQVVNRFMCQGKMPLSVKEKYEMRLKENPEDTKSEMFLVNFEVAMPHPDKNDLENLKDWVDSISNS